MGLLDSQIIELPCENCSRVAKKTIGWVKANRQLTCACGTVITLDASQLIRKLADLERTIGKIGKFK